MVIEIHPRNRRFAHPNSRPAVTSNETSKKLVKDWVVTYSQHPFAPGIFRKHVLKCGKVGTGQKSICCFYLAVKAQLSAHKLSRLHRALQRA